MRPADLTIPIRIAGEDDHLRGSASLRQYGAHRFEPMWIGVTEDVVKDHRDASTGSHDRGASEPNDYGQLLLRSVTEAAIRDRRVAKSAAHD